MNKSNYSKIKREEKGIDYFQTMYEYIRDALSQGVPKGCSLDETLSLMDQNENGLESLIDYEKVDRYFDEKYGKNKKAVKSIVTKAAQMYAPRFISKKIAQDYLRDSIPEKEQRRVRATDIYSWETGDMDRYLGTIFFYARRRKMVKQLSHYIDRGPNLINRVRERLQDDIKNLRENISRYHDEMPSASINRYSFIEKAKEKYSRLIKEYPSNHKKYIDKYKGYNNK